MLLSDVIDRCRRGEARAQRQVYERYAGRLFRVAQRYLRQHADAEDALVRGFQKVFAQLPRFEFHDEARLVSWLKTIVVNECLMLLRQRSSFALVSDTEAAEVPVDEDALDQLSAEEIHDLIRQLPDGYRTVFNLYALEGYTHAEIAQRLGISEGTSKSQLSKARQLLQRKIRERHDERPVLSTPERKTR